jgi:hypothetical protein
MSRAMVGNVKNFQFSRFDTDYGGRFINHGQILVPSVQILVQLLKPDPFMGR